ncbi:MAG: hypothetical protein KDE45_12535, partial [Caldilineaceae bacterium]|nr:hypothetical protein [Caldilineaceae bacterium]
AALAEKLKQSGAIVVVFLGDGTMGQGVVYESMNLASLWSLPLLFVLEDNQYAQSTHRSQEHAGNLAGRAAAFGIEGAELEADDVFAVYEAASRAVDFVRANSRPYFLTLHTYRLAPHSKGDDTRSPEELERQWARDPLTLLAATLDAQRRDEINAAIETRIQAAVEKALADEPQAVDEFRAAGMKRLGDWRLEIGESQSPNLVLSNLQSPVSNLQSPISYLESLRTTLHAILDHDPAAVVLGEDILDPYGGAFKVMQGLSTRFPDRVLTTPICEASIVGMSVGMALRGLHPIAEIMFGDFVTLAADQIVNHAAKYPAMYNGQVSMPLVIRTPMGGGRGYGPTHSQSLERLFFGIPHLKLVAASHAHDAGALLQQAVADPEPVIFVENKLLYPLRLERGNATITREEAPDSHGYPVVTLRNYGAGESPDVTVIAYGGMSRLLVPLLERLADEEIRLLACLPACISPLDAAPLVAAARQSGRVLVVEESPVAFGWGAEVAAQISALAGDRLLAPVARLGAAPTVIPAAKALEDAVLPSTASIEAAIFELLTEGSL